MAGSIRPDTKGAAKCGCGGAFTAIKDKEYRHEVPRCANCNKPPPRLRVRVHLPKVGMKDIRFNLEGTRLNTLALADAFLTDVKAKIQNKTFDPDNYLSPSQRRELTVENVAKRYMDEREVFRGQKRGCSPSYLDDCWKLYQNHLVPAFGSMDIREVGYPHLKDFLTFGKGGERQRIKALGLLKLVLQEACREHKSMTMPTMPQLPMSKRTSKKITRTDQLKVLAHVAEHREPLTLAVMYPIRPCEIRALRWCDVDLKNKVMTITQHFSGKEILSGRKSQQDPNDPYAQLELALFPEAVALFKSLPVQGIGEQLIFRTRRNNPLYESALRKSWNKGCERAGLPHISMYCGSKHSTMSFYLNEMGISQQELRAIAGHTNERTTQRYASRDSRSASKGLTWAPAGTDEA